MNKNLLEKILKKLKTKGCDEADVVFAEDSTISSSSRLGKIEKLKFQKSKRLVLEQSSIKNNQLYHHLTLKKKILINL